MKRRDFLKDIAAAGIGLANIPLVNAAERVNGHAGARKQEPVKPAPLTQRPHVILIMSDQHRGDALGCMGNKVVKTPHIDSLANDGTLFVSGYTASPSSTPARAGLLTGMSPWHHGMLGYGRMARKYKYEGPQMLRDLGYFTYAIGKNHWYPQKSLHGYVGTLVDESGRVEEPDFISDYHAWFQLHAPGKDPDATGIGWNDHGAGIYHWKEQLHPTWWTGQTACELIRNYDAEQPLFLKVSFARPHSPYDPPQRFYDMYKDVDVPAPWKGDWDGKYAALKRPDQVAKDAAFANLGDEYAKNSRRHYYANISFIDEQVGEIIKLLKEKGMYDNALICYTADHGDMLGDHYHWRKTYAYEGSAKIPFIIKWPSSMGIPKGTRIENPVELRDLLPTFLEMAGGKVPEDMDGKSLVRLAAGDSQGWRKYIDMEHAVCYSPDNYWCALTDGKIKYIWFFHTGKEQLFDLVKDPGETTELSQSRKYRKRLLEMRSAMVAHLSERGEGFVKDGKLVVREKNLLYSPHYPASKS